MRGGRLAILIALGLTVGVHRMPAPVVEEPEGAESPKPAMMRKHKDSAETKPREAPLTRQSFVRFYGTWRGTANGRINQALFGQRDFSSTFKIEVSADERTVTWTSSAWMFARFHATAQKTDRTLSWSTERHDIAGRTAVICRLEQTGDGVARYSESSGLVNGAFKGAGYELVGTLTRQ